MKCNIEILYIISLLLFLFLLFFSLLICYPDGRNLGGVKGKKKKQFWSHSWSFKKERTWKLYSTKISCCFSSFCLCDFHIWNTKHPNCRAPTTPEKPLTQAGSRFSSPSLFFFFHCKKHFRCQNNKNAKAFSCSENENWRDRFSFH